MLRRGYLSGYEHGCLFFHSLHPGQGFLAVAFKAAGLGAWFPHAASEHVAAFAGELLGGSYHLLLGLGGAGSCNYERANIVAGQVEGL